MTYAGGTMVAAASGHHPQLHTKGVVTKLAVARAGQAVGFAAGPGNSGWVAYRSGAVVAYGGARRLGPAPAGFGPVTGIAATPSGHGFWLVDARGRVVAFDAARTYAGPVPRSTTVGIASSANGRGYLLLDSAGKVYTYGDAHFYGDASRSHGVFRQIVATPGYGGYWLLRATGGVYGFGNAHNYGPPSGGASGLHNFVAMAATPDGHGFWEATNSGLLRRYGDAQRVKAKPVPDLVAVIPSAGDHGYVELAGNGHMHSFGQAQVLVADRAVSPQASKFRTTTTVAPTATTVAPTTTPLATTAAVPTATALVAPAPPPVAPTTMVAPAVTTVAPTTATTTTATTVAPTMTATAGASDPPAAGNSDLTPPASLMPDSVFNSDVQGWALDPNSSEFAQDFVTDYQDNFGTVGVNSHPVYWVSATQSDSSVSVSSGCNNFIPSTGSEVPIPLYVSLNGSSDNPLIIYQPSSESAWEFWQATRNSDGTWSACWGGKLDLASSNGVFPAPYGLSTTGIAYLATTITNADIASGSIDHAIAVQLTACYDHVYPADREDCSSHPDNSPGQPPEGQWFRFPANLAMPSGLTPYAQMVFRAVQTYGMVVTDYAGAVMLVSEQASDWTAEGNSGTNPMTASWQGDAEYQVVNSLPWSQLQAVDPPS
jgi:hypothetical protein